jgi:hypothetical protein
LSAAVRIVPLLAHSGILARQSKTLLARTLSKLQILLMDHEQSDLLI